MSKGLLVLHDGLHVLLILEEDIGLLPQLITGRRYSFQRLTADDGDVIGEEEELWNVLVITLPAEGVSYTYLYAWHETLLQDGCLATIGVDRHQDCKRVLFEGLARSGQHVGTVLQPNHADDAEADVDQRVYAVLQLCQTSDLALVGLEGSHSEFVWVKVQVLSLEGECLEVVDGLDVVIAEGAQWLFLHLPTKLIIDCPSTPLHTHQILHNQQLIPQHAKTQAVLIDVRLFMITYS